MDSYTDVSEQSCGCGHRHMSCGTANSGCCNSGRQPDYPDMNTFPWAVSDDYAVSPSYSFVDNDYQNMNNVNCVSTMPGCLEQQHPVAMAYVPWQRWQTTYAPERGLVQGTIFPDLDLEFNYGRCGR